MRLILLLTVALGLLTCADTKMGTEPRPAPDGLLFHADWGTSLGNSDAALTDGGRFGWQAGSCRGGGSSRIVSTSANGRDFSTPNYLAVAADDWCELWGSWGTVPQVGDTLWISYEVRFTISGSGGDTHGTYFDDDPAGGVNWGPSRLGYYVIPGHGSSVTFVVSAGAGEDPRYFTPGFPLQKNTTYQIVTAYRPVAGGYQLDAWIYDMEDRELAGPSDFRDDYWYDGTPKLQGRTFTRGSNRSMSGLKIGLEDPQGSGIFAEYADVRVRVNCLLSYRVQDARGAQTVPSRTRRSDEAACRLAIVRSVFVEPAGSCRLPAPGRTASRSAPRP